MYLCVRVASILSFFFIFDLRIVPTVYFLFSFYFILKLIPKMSKISKFTKSYRKTKLNAFNLYICKSL
jgi:hypothetical protein